jgi:DNA-binding response OmpR family regulator
MGKTVLLVEDDLDLRDLLQDILESEGYDVIPATDGHQALEYLRTSHSVGDAPALMILDLMIPLVNGWQVLEAIRNNPSLQVPVVVVSASGRLPPEGVPYLHKPFHLADLLASVHQSS